MNFNNKHVLVTGGASGIGYEITRHFAKASANISIFDYNEETLKSATENIKNEFGVDVHGYFVDISNKSDVESVVNKAEATAPIDVLINNAGVAFETPFLKIDADEWKKIIDINLTGMFYVAQAVCNKMATRKKGAVVNMGSKNGLDGEFGYAHYNSSKGGVVMLTKTMALELAHLNIRVNCVCPGYIQTPMSMEIDSPEFTKGFVDRYIPLNRPGKVEEVAPAFLFLASDENSFMTGQTIVIDGGQLAGQKPGNDVTTDVN